MKPFVKWAGGKRQILDEIIKQIREASDGLDDFTYYEPFVGGGAVLFTISPQQAFINDIIRQLMNLYMQLKVAANSVIEIVNEMDSAPCSRELYYSMRDRYNVKVMEQEFDLECAALMIWINKHCFNGLHRVNKQGFFNVPYNNKVSGKSINEDNIRSISDYLNSANIEMTCLDFEEACDGVSAGDFVYFDSPYVPESATASFTNYTVEGFNLADHMRLAALFRRLDAVGAKVMLSNNDVPLVHELYAGYNIQSVDVKRMINSNADRRTGREVLITNY